MPTGGSNTGPGGGAGSGPGGPGGSGPADTRPPTKRVPNRVTPHTPVRRTT